MKRILSIFLYLLLIAQPALAVVDPIGWWNLNEGSGTNAADSGSGGNAGTLINTPPWISGHIGTNALTFARASSEYIDVGTGAALNITGNMTLCSWFNAATLPTSNGEYFILAEKGYNGGTDIEQYFLRFTQSSGTPFLQFGSYESSNDHFAQYAYGGAITTGTWYHTCGRFDGTTYKIYVDGVEQASLTDSNAPQASGQKFLIGGADIAGTPDRFFNGSLDDIRLYNRALTPTEISDMANQTEAGPSSAPKRRVIVVE